VSDYLSMVAAASAAVYDRCLGPWQFEPYALELAGRLSDLITGSLLETAAGTGVLTRVLAQVLPEAVAIVATDLNQSRLDYAAAQPGAARVTWRQADALDLPFDNAVFDVVVCQFGVMFFPDKVAGYREALRVLKPGGRFLFNVWDRVEAVEFTNLVLSALADIFPQEPPRNLAGTAFGYHQTGAIEDQLREAGFRSVAVETIDMVSRLASPRDLAVGVCHGTLVATEIEDRRPGGLAAVTDSVAAWLTRHLGDGPIAGKMRAHVISARS